MNYKVSPKRHLAKTVSYRILSTGIGFLFMWWATGSIKIGTAFGIAELVYKPIQYYLHERLWYRFIKFGLIPEKKSKPKKNSSDEETTVLTEQPKEPKKKVLNYSSNR